MHGRLLTRQVNTNSRIRTLPQIIVAVEEAICITYWSVCSRVRVGVGVRMRIHAFSLAFPACNAYAPYCEAICCPSSTKFFDISHKRCGFGKKLLNMKCVFWFSIRFFSKPFLILRWILRDFVTNVSTSSCKVTVFLVGFQWNLNFLDRFSKNSSIKFYQNPSSGSRVVACGRTDGRTDRHDEANSLRQPVLGSIPRKGTPEISSWLDIWHINLLTCMRRVIRTAVQRASLFRLNWLF